ncbi:hypothetical protein NUU61_000601 [Penicillium alfredii]|uniref:Uncharacterized protein n=1 Tax=Penicillium alfredii TaxID=1506179 RepID=A0A9W9KR19_9EURO|nr:uncharacterized protein NUU61_000601 [Penicillium alfredii]KAJ5114842.1 hypothetical protein NUU61_000601 [Penicillium alfredii]
MVCQGAFRSNKLTIDEQRKQDWSQDPERRLLNYWDDFLSYSLYHELVHLVCHYKDRGLPGGINGLAYAYKGATALLRKYPDKVDNNVENLTLLILGK